MRRETVAPEALALFDFLSQQGRLTEKEWAWVQWYNSLSDEDQQRVWKQLDDDYDRMNHTH